MLCNCVMLYSKMQLVKQEYEGWRKYHSQLIMFERPEHPGQKASEGDKRSIAIEIESPGHTGSNNWDVFCISKYKVSCCHNLANFYVLNFDVTNFFILILIHMKHLF